MARHRLDEDDGNTKWGGPDLRVEERKDAEVKRHSKEAQEEPETDQSPSAR